MRPLLYSLLICAVGANVQSQPAPAPSPAPAGAAAATSAPPPDPNAEQKATLEAIKKGTFGRTTAAVLDAAKAEVKEPPKTEEKKDNAALVKELERDVAIGRWQALSEKLTAAFPDIKLRQDAFQAILNSLAQPKVENQDEENRAPQGFRTVAQLNLADVIELMTYCPVPEPGDGLMASYVTLINTASRPGPELTQFLDSLEKGAGPFGGTDRSARLRAAKVLLNSGKGKNAGPFLPAAEAEEDTALLNLRTRQLEAVYDDKRRPADLEAAWTTAIAAFKAAKIPGKDRDEALTKLVALSSRVPEKLEKAWMNEVLAEHLEVCTEVLANAGLQTVRNRLGRPSGERERNLATQHRLTEAILKAAPDRAKEWKPLLELLARNWQVEADLSLQQDRRTNYGPQMEFDPFGNVYFSNREESEQNFGGGMGDPISTAEILKKAPSQAWLDALDPSLAPAFYRLLANLHLKTKEIEQAFPYIEKLAAVRPDSAASLAGQLLEKWAEKNDPNNEQRRTSRYMFIYGYNPSSGGIPLTRSRQIRNLDNLAEWVKKIRALKLEKFDEKTVLQAFIKCHGMAEVYRLEDVHKALGAPDELSPETVAAFSEAMRTNLAGQWRDEKLQVQAKTGRKEKDIREEVLRGYAAAKEIVSAQLKKNPDNWRLLMERGALTCDENVFISEEQKDAGFAKRREEAFGDFKAAAAAYAKTVQTLEEKDQTDDLYETWFYCAMGASDLAKVKAEQVPSPQQIPLIKEAIAGLGGEVAKKHETMFANSLATRISAVGPAVKQRYVELGLQIAGDNERAKPVREVAEYYKDIVREIALDVKVDGEPVVGTEPFGVWVNIRHTAEVERAGGGFQKYLVNQNNNPMFWNFGRPPENYRDKFTDGVKEALGESFDILSVTFHSEKVQSQGDPQSGWRFTPYAFLHLKSKGPQVDVIPPLKLSLDFTETNGFVILPIASGRLPIDSSKAPAPAVLSNVQISQTLDERKLAEGKVELEVQATAEGLLPALDKLASLDFGDFEVVTLDDGGVQLNELKAVPDEPSKVLSARNWTVKLQRKTGAGSLFRFPKVLNDSHKMANYRYEENDLKEIGPEVVLTGRVAGRSGWIAAGIAAGVAVLGFLFYWLSRSKGAEPEAKETIAIPSPLTPLNLLGYLRKIRALPELDAEARKRLDADIEKVQTACYAPQGIANEQIDLSRVASQWAAQAAR